MQDDQSSEITPHQELLARAIAKETGITPDQAHLLIKLIGTERNSLLREARAWKTRG
ncbi:hypothetical protein NKJ26_03095 [Mesorhizobium sp. M0152]|uniref:hypothetical protein n=1 Tax=Mesorhizobium sp. M0152 TaxID=2956898 RepID=UPI00333C760C